jgi:formylglycine-generating enzyme required for sulfatase activity
MFLRLTITCQRHDRDTHASGALSRADNAPRDSISWFQALAFTHWLDTKYRELGLFEELTLYVGGRVGSPSYKTIDVPPSGWQIRLPTEWEWQWAAQAGSERREYPWGAWDGQPRANTREAGMNERSTSVGMYPDGAAECGALDMAGNLSEWCLNEHKILKVVMDGTEMRALRGGSYGHTAAYARSDFRYDNDPELANMFVGLRIVCAARNGISISCARSERGK